MKYFVKIALEKPFTFISIAFICFLSSCNEEELQNPSDSEQNTPICQIDTTYLTNNIWLPPISAFATIEFNTNGIYYENGIEDGNWSLINDCDSIYVTRPSNSFYYRILELSNDTLIIYNSVFGEVTYRQ